MSIDPSANPPAQPFRLFVSYAHKNDEDIKDRLLIHLAPSVGSGLIELWEDRAILVGAKWRDEIGRAMDWADGAVFLVSADFLASDFCNNVEVPTFLQRYQEDEHVLLIYVLVNHCDWQLKPYIDELQILPPKAKPIRDYRNRDLAYTEITRGIRKCVSSTLERRSHLVQLTASKPEPTALSLSTLLEKLPSATTHLFGRDTELAQINSWKDHKGVFLWVADGGTGKSALVRWWLEHQAWPAGTRFLGHSFYSQGSHNQGTSSRSFLIDALKQLNVQHEINAADDELGRLLAEAVAVSPTVLVLDGIEPLQQVADDDRLNGMVKDRGLAVLLEKLAHQPGQSLCLASSRLRLPESSIADAAYFRQRVLGLLPSQGALQLLRQRGVRGKDGELGEMAERCGHHPLALVLAAEFCHTFMQDSAAEFLQREWQPKTGEARSATVMAWFDSALADEHQKLDQELVRILGLFDRPAPWGALQALKQAAPIAGLTVALHEADDTSIMESLARLSQWGLLNADLTSKEPELDAHPLVREHFGELLEKNDHQAWQAAHSVLFDWFCSLPVKEQPDTLDELEPLYRAIGHGCKAGSYLQALAVYWQRVRRGSLGYSLFYLGAWSLDLAALANFFPSGWSNPPVEDVGVENCIGLSHAAAFYHMSLGYINDAYLLAKRNLERVQTDVVSDDYCRSSEMLLEILAVLGKFEEAEEVATYAIKKAVENKKQITWRAFGGLFASLGRVLHGLGKISEAITAFKRAESIQSTNNPKNTKLFSLYGYDYAQLLFEMVYKDSACNKILKRGQSAMKVEDGKGLLSNSLAYCVIGQTKAYLGINTALSDFNQAVDLMQRAGRLNNQPSMYLARAHYKRSLRDLVSAWTDHDAAHSIAERGNMRTYLAECALLAGNLCLDESRVPDAAAQYATASQLIREDGYGRRYAELYLLHARLLHAQHDPAARQALAEAEARIREVGQWFFWRELCAVAKEIGAPDPGKCPA